MCGKIEDLFGTHITNQLTNLVMMTKGHAQQLNDLNSEYNFVVSLSVCVS